MSHPHTLRTRMIQQCDRCKGPIRKAGEQQHYGPIKWEHTEQPCTPTHGTGPFPLRVCAADGGTLTTHANAHTVGERCTTCGNTSRFSTGH